MLEGRIDYAKWVISGHYDVVMRKAAQINDAFEYEAGRYNGKKPSDVRNGDYHDGKRKCHVAWVEVYGPLAHNVVSMMGSSEARSLVRLDWRIDVEDEQYTYREMYHAFKSHSNAKNTFMEMDSKERSKKNGRDSGGRSLYAGAAGSDRRLVYYQRGTERPAIETRFLHAACRKVVESAVNRYMSIERGNFIDCLTESLDVYSKELFYDRTGLPYDVVQGEVRRTEQHGIWTQQESLLQDIDDLVARLDSDARGALLDKLNGDMHNGTVHYYPAENAPELDVDGDE